MCSLNLGIKMGMKICDNCGKKVFRHKNESQSDVVHLPNVFHCSS